MIFYFCGTSVIFTSLQIKKAEVQESQSVYKGVQSF